VNNLGIRIGIRRLRFMLLLLGMRDNRV
jgi:hypothetical protein